jgi:6-carboxyhexanoate--CoA ligase
MSFDLFSIRMRASARQRHLSGAERITNSRDMDAAVLRMLSRARERTDPPDEIVITVERIAHLPVLTQRALDVTVVQTGDVADCRRYAVTALEHAGVAAAAARKAVALLDAGPAPSGGNMRGAVVMDAATGERLEPDPDRGVRVSRFDWSDEASAQADAALARFGLTHFRTKEALALATKVAHAPAMVAELCWSDDPAYVAGYVASRTFGYLRLPLLKEQGCGAGGRVFFVRNEDFDRTAFQTYVQQTPVIIDAIGAVGASDRPPERKA